MRVLYTRGSGLAVNRGRARNESYRREEAAWVTRLEIGPNSNLSAAREASMYTFWLCDIVSSPTIVRKHIGPN